MLTEFVAIYVQVILPVFALVGLGYVVCPRLKIEARPLSRAAYYIFVPAFILDVIGGAHLAFGTVAVMLAYIACVQLACAALGLGVAWALGRTRRVVAAYVVIGVFGNIGNFGLPLIAFRLGDQALVPATVYFVGILFLAFVISVSTAGAVQGRGLHALRAVFRTPSILAFAPALALALTQTAMPVGPARAIHLLGSAMVPTMLLALGAQLAAAGRPAITWDVCLASAVRLAGAPLLAILLAGLFGIGGVERAAGILQEGMPAAVLAAIIALEYDLVPDFVTTAVIFSTLCSFVTLPVLMALV